MSQAGSPTGRQAGASPEGRERAVQSSQDAAFWQLEDWWAVLLGLGLVALGYALFESGSSLSWLAVVPPSWSTPHQLLAHFAANWERYAAQFLVWLVIISVALVTLGYRLRETIPGFLFLYIVSVVIFAIGQWADAIHYNLEPPLVALILGLVLANFGVLPRGLDAAFRVEFYVKLGIVLLGATLPFTLIVWAGPVALIQASIVSVVTFLVIFALARTLGLDPRFAATLGVGGAVCGVSAAIAVAAAVGARKQDAPVVISIVIVWAIVMIFALPLVSSALDLPAGVGGAWIGTSEFADAAGLAAAQAYGDIAAHVRSAASGGAAPAIADQSIAAFTLMKVVGRDIWIGVWAVILSIVATTRWETTGIENRGKASEIWRRFPKFVIGFIIASAFITLVAQQVGHAQFGKVLNPNLIVPIKNLRTWAFAFGFLSIGLTMRFRELASAGLKPVIAFSFGVVVNVALGFVLSALVFGAYWATLGH